MAGRKDRVRVGIVGVAGIAGERLIELLISHPGVEIKEAFDVKRFEGKSIEELHPSLRGRTNLRVSRYSEEMVKDCDVVFFSTPHGFASKHSNGLLKKGLKVIDLSGDHRLKNPKLYEVWYNFEHPHPELLKKAVYGLPELYYDEIKKASVIANPGCYPTSVILGCAPILSKTLAYTEDIIVHSISGVSGAGRGSPSDTQFIDLEGNIRPYKMGVHQHTPEMEQELRAISGSDIKILFVPNVAGFSTGIISTIYLRLKRELFDEKLYKIYTDFYKGKPFVRVYEPGSIPQIKNVVGSNFCDIGLKYDKRTARCIIISVIDNTIKGASGLAIQNMNIMMGFKETEGFLSSNL